MHRKILAYLEKVLHLICRFFVVCAQLIVMCAGIDDKKAVPLHKFLKGAKKIHYRMSVGRVDDESGGNG